MSTIREVSTRACITPKKFVNFYSYGDFKGDEEEWMDKYFDAFLYMANWGTRRLILRFPNNSIDRKLIDQFCPGEIATCRITKRHTIIEYYVEESEEGGWLDEENDFLEKLLPLRDEVLCDDYRLLYLGWLLCVQYGDLEETELEPPVPGGLGDLSPALHCFINFFNLDRDLLKSVASRSTKHKHQLIEDEIEPLISGLTEGEKHRWLCRLALHDNPNLKSEFMKFILADSGLELFSDERRRTIEEIRSYTR